MEGALSLQMRNYLAQCVGALDGQIEACYDVAKILVKAWHAHEDQRKLCSELKSSLRDSQTAEDIAFSASKLIEEVGTSSDAYIPCLYQIRDTCRAKTVLEIKYSVVESKTVLLKRELEDHQRLLNDMHMEISKLVKDIKQIGGKYTISMDIARVFTESDICIKETSPLQIIKSL